MFTFYTLTSLTGQVMKTFDFKAKRLMGGWYDFKISDVPTFIREDQIVLYNKPGSPILIPSSILRGFDGEYFEGNVYMYRGNKYILGYYNGFALYSRNSKPISTLEVNLEELEYLGNIYEDYHTDFKLRRQKIYLKYKKHNFMLDSILGMYQREVILAGTRLRVKPKDILVSGTRKFYIGSFYEGKQIRLYKGRVCIADENNNIIDLGKGEF